MAEINRRGFFGGSFLGLTTFVAPEHKPLSESEEIFESIHSVPLIPLDSWFNQPRLGWELDSYGFINPELWMFRHPQIFMPRNVMEDSIKETTLVRGCNGPIWDSSIDEDEQGDLIYQGECAFFVRNFQIVRLNDNIEWLIADLKFVHPKADLEFQGLTECRKVDLLEDLEQEHDGSWPKYRVGLTNTGLDFLPVGCGDISITKLDKVIVGNSRNKDVIAQQYGVRFENYKILTVSMLAIAPYFDPLKFDWLWVSSDPRNNSYQEGLNAIEFPNWR